MTGLLSVVGSLVATVLFVGSGLVVAATVKRCFFAHWRATLGATVLALVWLCWALAIGQLLGAVGLLRPLPLTALAVATALAALALGRDRQPSAAPEPAPAPPEPTASRYRWEDVALTVGVVLLVLLVASIWTARTVIALRRGINDPDSLGYHLPLMATFAHSGYADQHRLLIPLYPVQFYPANDELLSAMALLLTHSVAFAALKNLLYGVLLLVEAHALGSAYRAGRLAMAAAAVGLGFPVIAFSQPGAGVNDCLLLATVLGGLAVLAHARDRGAPYVLALASAGLALGVKFSGIVPAAALAGLAVVLLVSRVPRHRVGWATGGLLLSAGLGGSWYVRNAITYGNPVPPNRLSLGPIHLRGIISYAARNAYSVAHYLLRLQEVRVFGHSAVSALGAVGMVFVVAGLVAAVVALGAHDGYRRGLAAFALIGVIGYLWTPAGAAGTRRQIPYAITVNLHYAATAMIAALIVAALAVARRRGVWVLPFVGIAAVLTGIRPGQAISIWFPDIGGPSFWVLVLATVVGGAAALAWSRPGLRRFGVPAAALALVVAMVGLVAIAGHYRSRRVTDPVSRWAAHVPATSVAGWISNIADLYGPHARNQVTVVARLDHGAAAPMDTCQGWKKAVVDGHFSYTAVLAGTAWARWLRADQAFVIVAHGNGTTIFQVVGQPDLDCVGQTNQGADFWVLPGTGA